MSERSAYPELLRELFADTNCCRELFVLRSTADASRNIDPRGALHTLMYKPALVDRYQPAYPDGRTSFAEGEPCTCK